MGYPWTPSNSIPDGEDWIPRRFTDIERYLRELSSSIGPSIMPIVARLDATDADLAAKQVTLDAQQATLTAQQGTLATQTADLAAKTTAIANNLASINSLLTQVVKPQSVSFKATGFAITTAGAVRASQTINVPAGYTQAVVSVVSRVHAINPTGATDFLYSTAQVGAVAGDAHGTTVLGGNGSGINVDAVSTVLTALSGGSTFTLVVNVASQVANWSAQPANAAEMSGMILWLK